MTLEEKIRKTEIKKILIVDDKPGHTQAAKEYFTTLESHGVKTEYANSAKEAKEKIQQAYESKDKYSVVISDMQMEQEKSGLEVVREGFKHQAYGFIATGVNYEKAGSHGHGPSTHIEPFLGSIQGRKDKPEVWKQVFEKTLDYLTQKEGKDIHAAIKRHDKYVGTPSERVAETLMIQYSHLKK